MAKRASELETLTMVYSYVGYCQCGYEVWIEYLRYGTGWFHRFFDSNHQEISKCPDCGKVLNEDDLESLKNWRSNYPVLMMERTLKWLPNTRKNLQGPARAALS